MVDPAHRQGLKALCNLGQQGDYPVRLYLCQAGDVVAVDPLHDHEGTIVACYSKVEDFRKGRQREELQCTYVA